MSFSTYIANTFFLFLNKRRYKRFLGNAKQLATVQEKTLLNILAENNDTQFGRSHHFASIDGIASFQNAVPVSNYECYQQYIARIMKGETAVLTNGPVLNLVPTSGTASQSKYIPYTQSTNNYFYAVSWNNHPGEGLARYRRHCKYSVCWPGVSGFNL